MPLVGVILICIGGVFAYSSLGIIPKIFSDLNAGSGYIGSGVAFLFCIVVGLVMVIHGFKLVFSGGRRR